MSTNRRRPYSCSSDLSPSKVDIEGFVPSSSDPMPLATPSGVTACGAADYTLRCQVAPAHPPCAHNTEGTQGGVANVGRLQGFLSAAMFE
jgi:hypothetical protein